MTRAGSSDCSEPPVISIVMPVRNEAAFIERSLASVLNQDSPMSQGEVLVADGISDARDVEIVRRMGEMRRPAVLARCSWEVETRTALLRPAGDGFSGQSYSAETRRRPSGGA
jgi:glycosyltransferase involved in cell wall biosynthesis